VKGLGIEKGDIRAKMKDYENEVFQMKDFCKKK
jgi:hypothetical protein